MAGPSYEDCQTLVTPPTHTAVNMWVSKYLETAVSLTPCSILLALTTLSYLPQVCSIISHRSTFGYALLYSLLNLLFATSQLSLTVGVIIHQIPLTACIDKQAISGMRALSASLGLLQATSIWIGSFILYVCGRTLLLHLGPLTIGESRFFAFFIYPDEPPAKHEAERLSRFAKTSTLHERRPQKVSRRAALAVATTWIAAFLIPLAAIAFPKPPRPDEGVSIFMGACANVLSYTIFVFLISQFIPQIKLMHHLRHEPDTTSISPWTLGLHFITFVVVGVSWRAYLYQLRPGYLHDLLSSALGPIDWYTYVGWRWFNYILFALGQGMLLCLYVYYRYQSAARRNNSQRGSSGTDVDVEVCNERTRLI